MNEFALLSWIVLLAAFPDASECRTEPGSQVSKVAGTLATLSPGTTINAPASTVAPSPTSAPESRLSTRIRSTIMEATSPYPGTLIYIALCGTRETLTGGSCSCPGSSNIVFAGPVKMHDDIYSWQCNCSINPSCPSGVPAGECHNIAYAVCAE
ncbi:hypothetical protein KFL_002020100 [Klebsormidium nitens]|uniref:Uncharacterized protein n=1 Tax=Klebsormidium nitens TaxID=105231 RepID=A0A1Y1I1C4_KLENI|nr:hypothetical protein KFL_002020100 [Klebsormidium nitens]|eukprot:GAQ84715.1 hypothetical protein KFL_002020100 [Klebsormidium nitens]